MAINNTGNQWTVRMNTTGNTNTDNRDDPWWYLSSREARKADWERPGYSGDGYIYANFKELKDTPAGANREAIIFAENGKVSAKTFLSIDEYVGNLWSLTPKEVAARRKKLRAAGFNIPQGTRVDEDFINANLQVARALTQRNYFTWASGRGGKPLSFDEYLASGIVGGDVDNQTTVRRTIVETDRKDANYLLKTTMSTLLGADPTDKDYKDFYKKLNAAQRKTYQTETTTGGTTRVTGRQFDLERFVTEYVFGKTKWSKDLEGTIGDIQDSVNQLLNDNGIKGLITQKDKIDYIKRIASGEMKPESLKAQLNDLAKTAYAEWAPMLEKNPTMTLREIAAPYIGTYANLMDQDGQTVDIGNVLKRANKEGKVMSLFEFQQAVRKDPNFQKTTTAFREASAFGKAFARSMGVNV